MRAPKQTKQEEKLQKDEKLLALEEKAQRLFDCTKAVQSEEYYNAAEAFNAAAIKKLGRENVGTILMQEKKGK